MNSFFSVCTYLYKVYMKLLDRLKGLMTSLSLTLKTKNPTVFFYVYCEEVDSGQVCVVEVLVRWVLFFLSFHGLACISESAQLFCL